MYCLDANNGDSLWRYYSGGKIEMGATVTDNRVFFGAWYQNYIWCLDAITGNLIWRGQPETNFMFAHSMPAVHDSLVFIGTSRFGVAPTKFYALKEYPINPPNGEIVWKCSTGTGVQHQPLSVGNGRAYGSVDGGQLYCMREHPTGGQGEILWSVISSPGGGGDPSCVSIKGDTIYYGHERGFVYARRASDGGIIWEKSSLGGHSGVGSVTITPTRLYVGTGLGSSGKKIICYNRTSGDTIWTYQTNGYVTSTPTVVNGMLFATSQDGRLYAFGNWARVTEENKAKKNIYFSITPNPFNLVTTVRFQLPASGYAALKIYDIKGELMKTLVAEPMTAGNYTFKWNGKDNKDREVKTGTYFCQLEFNKKKIIQKLIVMK